MAKRGTHAAQVDAAGTAMVVGHGTDIAERWNFVQVVHLGVSTTGAGSLAQLMSASNRAGESRTGSLFGLTHCASSTTSSLYPKV